MGGKILFLRIVQEKEVLSVLVACSCWAVTTTLFGLSCLFVNLFWNTIFFFFFLVLVYTCHGVNIYVVVKKDSCPLRNEQILFFVFMVPYEDLLLAQQQQLILCDDSEGDNKTKKRTSSTITLFHFLMSDTKTFLLCLPLAIQLLCSFCSSSIPERIQTFWRESPFPQKCKFNFYPC